jgi:hypothetical protein
MVTERGFTHMIVRFDLLKKWSEGLNDAERALLVQYLETNTKAILIIGEYGLFEVKS